MAAERFEKGAAVKVYGLPGRVVKVASGGKRLLVEQATRTLWVAADRATTA